MQKWFVYVPLAYGWQEITAELAAAICVHMPKMCVRLGCEGLHNYGHRYDGKAIYT